VDCVVCTLIYNGNNRLGDIEDIVRKDSSIVALDSKAQPFEDIEDIEGIEDIGDIEGIAQVEQLAVARSFARLRESYTSYASQYTYVS
jgi:hypothetical protein